MAGSINGMALTDTDTLLPGASLSHIAGSLFGLATLTVGGRLLIPRGSEGPEILPLLREFRPTVLWMLPAALIALVRDHDADSSDFASIRLCSSGGDKVSAELEREFTAIAGFPIDESYGMTEFGLSTINPLSGENRLGSIGKVCPGYEMSLRDDSGAEVPVGTPGRLWIRSDANMIGYWENPKATAETIVDGWLDTGDMMTADEDGYLWFCGRKKQIIIHDGSNICPQEVEEALTEHPVDRRSRCDWHSRSRSRRECASLRDAEGRRPAALQHGSDPLRPRSRRLQSARGNRVPGRNAVERHWQGRPCDAAANG